MDNWDSLSIEKREPQVWGVAAAAADPTAAPAAAAAAEEVEGEASSAAASSESAASGVARGSNVSKRRGNEKENRKQGRGNWNEAFFSEILT